MVDRAAPASDEDVEVPTSIAAEGVRIADETGAALRHLTDTVEDGVSEDAITTEALRRANVLLGDRCMATGNLNEAWRAYAAAGATDKLIAVGDRYLKEVEERIAAGDDISNAIAAAQVFYLAAGAAEQLIVVGGYYLVVEGRLDNARAAYAAAGAEMPAEKLIACGDRCLEAGRLEDAQEAYKAGGGKISNAQIIATGDRCMERGAIDGAWKMYAAARAKDKLIAVGDRLLEDGRLEDAQEAYKAGGREISQAQLLAFGDRYMAEERSPRHTLPLAAEAYEAAGATDKLIPIGDCWLKMGELSPALWCYATAGATDKLIALGNRCVAEAKIDDALKAYAAAGVEIPQEQRRQLILLGDRYMAEGGFLRDARKAYEAAGAKDKLIAVGDRDFEKGQFADARKAYEAAGAADKLIAVGDRYVPQRMLDEALQTYAAAERIKLAAESSSAA